MTGLYGKALSGRLAMVLAFGLLAGCQGSLDDLSPKAERALPSDVINTMKAQGMTRSSPVMVRIFKEENILEVWKQKDTGRYGYVKSYEICKWSGKLGPKIREGDRQAPEGFYTVRPAQMNPLSSYHLAFNIGYPNTYDRSHGRTGSHLMVHGACSSAGCYSMTDEQVEEIYAFARDSFRGGQRDFQIQAYPFKMTAENMARHRDNSNIAFWKMLKEGYDNFELTKLPPKVDVCNRRYVFNQTAVDGEKFKPNSACPQTTQPESLILAYQKQQREYNKAYAAIVAKLDKKDPPADPVQTAATPTVANDVAGEPDNSPDTSSLVTGATTAAASSSPVLQRNEVKKPWWKVFSD